MKSVRPNIVLYMCYTLQERGYFTEEGICADLRISRSTFFRALSDFRCFEQEYRPFEELCFDPISRKYEVRDIRIARKK